jgi:hypothetical protein
MRGQKRRTGESALKDAILGYDDGRERSAISG